MIDLYDEVGYIKNVLYYGIGQKWQRDVTLLTRYFKLEGLKKSEVKQKMLDKCELAANREKNRIIFNRMQDYKRLNTTIENAWKKDIPLRQITQIEISQEILDWFLELENSFIMTDEEVAKEKQKRPKVSIKHNKPINFERTKYLFTLYIWTKIQENYLDKPNMHYLKKYNKRFKHDANLKTSFNLTQERNLLYDLGFINVNYALGIDASFIKKYDVFNTPITDKNRIIIKGSQEEGEGDLFNCGYWLEKQKMGSFVCQNCGKEFANYRQYKKGGTPRKYCKECAELIGHNKHNNKNKIITCIDCDKEIEIDIQDGKTQRCVNCQIKHEQELTKNRVIKYRKKQM